MAVLRHKDSLISQGDIENIIIKLRFSFLLLAAYHDLYGMEKYVELWLRYPYSNVTYCLNCWSADGRTYHNVWKVLFYWNIYHEKIENYK